MHFGGLVLILGGLFYFLPTLVGHSKQNVGAIFVLNLLLGWTLVGWVVALVWALTADAPAPVTVRTPVFAGPFCAGCGAVLPAYSRFCPICGRPAGA